MKENDKTRDRIYKMALASFYPFYVQKVEKKGRSKKELDKTICWLTGYTQKGLEVQIEKGANLEMFFTEAPNLNPKRSKITGVICGVRVEEIKDPVVKLARQMDKLVDEIAKGKPMEKVLREVE